MPSRLGFLLTDEDLKLLKKIQQFLAKSQGDVSQVTVIRFALRKTVEFLGLK